MKPNRQFPNSILIEIETCSVPYPKVKFKKISYMIKNSSYRVVDYTII